MWSKVKNWFGSWGRNDEYWYLENAKDHYDLEVRLITLQRQGMRDLYMRYWYGR